MGGVAVVALVALAGITIKWTTFHSDLYPYTISQPSSYQHIVQPDTSGRMVDYFYPSLGSTITNVNVYCDHTNRNTIHYLSSIGGKNVHRSDWIAIMGKRYALIRADFSGVGGMRFTIEQMTAALQGRVWHLTASYDHRFRNQRPIMMKMLRSFQTTSIHGRKLTH